MTIGFGARDYRGPDAFVQWETLELLIEGVSLYTGADYKYQTPYRSGTAPLNVNLLADAPKAIRLKPQPDTDYSALTLDLPKNQCEFTARGHINGDTAVEITVDLGGLVAFIPRGERFRWSAGEDTFIGVLLDAAQLLDAVLVDQLSADSSGTIRISEADNPQMYHKIVERIIRAFSIYNDPNHDGTIDESEQDEGETADSDPFKIKCEYPEKDCTAPDGSFPDRMCINNDVYECSIVRDARGCPIAETYNTLVESCETDTCTRGENQMQAAFCTGTHADGDIDPDVDDMIDIDNGPEQGPHITVSPISSNFFTVHAGTTATVDINICNIGSEVLTVSTIQWASEEHAGWSYSTEAAFPISIQTNDCIEAHVDFSPDADNCPDFTRVYLHIASNDAEYPLYEVDFSAGCDHADGDVDINDTDDMDEEETETTNGPVMELRPQSMNLGVTGPGIPISKPFDICNTGNEPLLIYNLGFDEGTSSEWELETEYPFSGEIAAGTCATINVSFTPNADLCIDMRIADIVIISNYPFVGHRTEALIGAGCIPSYANPGLELRANYGDCDGKAQVDLIYNSPIGTSCSEQTMNSLQTCNFEDYGQPRISSYATTCADGTYEEITHINPADGDYMFCIKLMQDCDHYGFNLFGEEICLTYSNPDFTISLYELVMENGSPVASSTPIYSVTGNLSSQGDMRCWSLERINGEYPNAPQPVL